MRNRITSEEVSPLKKIEFSKLIIVVAAILFAATLIHCFTNPALDTGAMATEIAVTGGLFSTSVVAYYNKSKLENVHKLRMSQYEKVAGIEYKYYEKKMRLKKELGLTESDIQEVYASSVLDDYVQEALNMDNSFLEEKMTEASANEEPMG